MTGPDPFRHDDAAYVMGVLDDAERVAFERHLQDCPQCRARVDQARATLGLLAGVAEPEPAPPLPDTLLPGLLRSAARERRRRRGLVGGLAGVAAACAVALVVLLWPAAGSSGAGEQHFAAVRPNPVTATARLTTETWGTEIELRCRYAPGVTSYEPYTLLVTDRAGHRQAAGSWTLAPGGTTTLHAGTALSRQQIARLEITLPDGTPILQLSPL